MCGQMLREPRRVTNPGEVEKAAQKSWHWTWGWEDEEEFARKRNIRKGFQAKV